ncbi:max-binding protein MNT [Latimeria chalumnae]|uniref:Max-binding protein MNT n=1 Tax=Latimeria chalumnae TaxID=7897 RepID=H3BFE5_LATCH|nr:PREDICTED: max-binding protein MNT [Latimeria chalumnae]|eukprot:XP_005987541.1 PREDICTED: max-binding protein MNT [Latimeria chalumnae]
MSIETLLEAARFLEWQAQQQQKTREENEKRERLHLEREQEQKKTLTDRVNHVLHAEEPRTEVKAVPTPAPPIPPPPPPPPPAPMTVIPIPVVTSPPQSIAPPTLSPLVAQIHQPIMSRPSNISKELPVPPVIQRPPGSVHTEPKPLMSPSASPTQLPQCPGPVLTIPQHPVIHQAIQPQLQQTQQHQPSTVKLSPVEEAKPTEQKRRPGGAGTREVHNKLEKNRRAHLKECFETLKRNIPNVDDKKTSNLSVLRSALRYIQTLKRKEKEYEHEMERLAREKIATQQRLAELKNELSQWMDVLEIDRILRQTVQPEDDQASTSTASEGEDNMDEDMDDDDQLANSLPKATRSPQLEVQKTLPPNIASHHSTLLPQHISIQQKPPPTQVQPQIQTQAMVQPQAIVPAQTHIVTAPTVQPTVIAHTATTHASVIQTVNHVIQGPQAKHIAHIAPSTSSTVQLATAAQPIGHITVHPATINHMTHLGQQLPTIYSQPMAVNQPVMSHIAHTISQQQVNGTANLGPPAVVTKQAVGTQVVHHQQLVGQTVLNPVTMVTMPSFPVSTLKLA